MPLLDAPMFTVGIGHVNDLSLFLPRKLAASSSTIRGVSSAVSSLEVRQG